MSFIEAEMLARHARSDARYEQVDRVVGWVAVFLFGAIAGLALAAVML